MLCREEDESFKGALHYHCNMHNNDELIGYFIGRHSCVTMMLFNCVSH
jgi:hypothetical protein